MAKPKVLIGIPTIGTALDNCTLSEGQCYKYCPRTYTNMDAISQQVFGVPYSEDELGATKEVLIARSTDAQIREKAQYGGTVTTLLSLALAEGLIDNAILTRTSDDKTPIAFLAQSAEEVLQGAGSNYMACPILETYNHLPKRQQPQLGNSRHALPGSSPDQNKKRAT